MVVVVVLVVVTQSRKFKDKLNTVEHIRRDFQIMRLRRACESERAKIAQLLSQGLQRVTNIIKT